MPLPDTVNGYRYRLMVLDIIAPFLTNRKKEFYKNISNFRNKSLRHKGHRDVVKNVISDGFLEASQ